MHLGTAFQLIDDVLDYSGEQAVIGKNLGDDLAEGKPTLPLIYAMQHGSAEQARLVRHAIEHGGRGELAAVIEAIRSNRRARLRARAGAARSRSAACEALGAPAAFKVPRIFATIGGLRGDADALADSLQRSAFSTSPCAARPRVFFCRLTANR